MSNVVQREPPMFLVSRLLLMNPGSCVLFQTKLGVGVGAKCKGEVVSVPLIN
jgi:hypothetical protein